MPKVHFVKKARKDNPAVKAGESYYWWAFRFGGKRYSSVRPRPSQLTSSDKLARIYEAQECVADALDDFKNDLSAVDELVEVLEDYASEVETVSEEYDESAENISERFGQTEQVEECFEKAEASMDLNDEIQTAVDEIGNINESDAPLDERKHDILDAVENIDWEVFPY